MTAHRTVRATGPADLLALVPGFLGFHPERSLVVMTLGGAGEPFHARVDLPGDPVETEDLATYLAGVARRSAVRTVALLLYTADAALAEAVADEVGGRLAADGARVACAVRADGRRWWWIGRAGPGTPYDPRAHPLMAEAVTEGTVVLGSRRELAGTLVADPVEVDRVARAAAGLAESLSGRDRSGLVADGRWVRRRVRRHLRDARRLDPGDAARLLVLLDRSLEVRDVAWAEMRHADAGRHVDLWRDLVRRAPPELRAAPAALLGFAAWLSGHGALAWCAVDCAERARPGYGLTRLLADALAGAVPPSAWRPVPEGALSLFAERREA